MILAAIQPPFVPTWVELRPFVAEVWLTITIVAVLIAPFFVRRSNAVCALVTLAGLVVALFSVLAVSGAGIVAQSAFRGMLVSDPVAVYWKVLLLLFTIGIVLLWFGSTRPSMHEGDGPEFFTQLLGATLGMSLMASTSNLLMLVIAVELASLPSYVLAGFRKTDRVGAEASLKYVLFGAATSSIMVYGLSLLYGLYGTLQIETIATRMAAGGAASPMLLAVALTGLIIGIGFKISAVPLHFWCPDVFEGAGIDVAAFLSVASKGAGLVLLLRILVTLATANGWHAVQPLLGLAGVIGVIGAVTCTVGNAAALAQENIKRLLAYSSIAHAGYMLCALSLLYSRGTADPGRSATQAILVYLAVYLFMNLGAFTVAGLVSRHGGGETVDDYAGLGSRSPVLAVSMAGCLFSLVGLPPFAGFLAKYNVMVALGQNGSWWWWLVAVIGFNTILSLFYYARIVKAMFLSTSEREPFVASPIGTAVGAMCAAILLLMLIAASPVQRLSETYARFYLPSAASPQVAPAAHNTPEVASAK
jgi:NADH-quinone oxidoreductase subunit N